MTGRGSASMAGRYPGYLPPAAFTEEQLARLGRFKRAHPGADGPRTVGGAYAMWIPAGGDELSGEQLAAYTPEGLLGKLADRYPDSG